MNTTTMKTRGRPAKIVVNEKFIDMYNNHSNAELAEKFGVTISAVQKAARKAEMRKTAGGRPCSMPDAKELKLQCAEHTDKEVAQIHGVCPGTVAYWRKKLGITKYNKNDVLAIA